MGKAAEVPEVAQLAQTLEKMNRPKVTPETITIEDTPGEDNASRRLRNFMNDLTLLVFLSM